ncbi:MAG: bifunctional (p)ppGpp synthetase/guanosine-3',5'-bis(diphosphate) 3'-pyrophosphohydrolase [Rhodospirillales bacterium]|jgi:GTP pyrophosphokinase|nr:bifunctional (p)ppGpp synthetase/guanosine-3',5'-bis(diphosphate) 3'-pyrophosphohydrolase [Rhodospirillales bacterium]
MIRQFELVERVKAYDPSADEHVLNRGYVFAMRAHGTQKRANGDPYFSHPLEVAGILTGYRLDTASIVTALLHDTIEDTGITLDDIELFFGEEIARLVDGVTKLNRIELQSERAKQAENFRKLVLAMSQDIRVLLVKLADRLHNMRTLCFIDNPEKRQRIAKETMEIYAPLAERIGMQEMKGELEDLAFAELNEHGRDSIVARLKFLRDKGEEIIPRIISQLRDTLSNNGLNAEVYGREKSPYSIWRKMQHNNLNFEQLCDIMAFRVIVDTVEDCYRALGIVHGSYPVIPGRFKDYISVPKPNGYRSLHTGVFGPERQRIEIQIRTRDMHEVAEFGVAAHWHYKQGGSLTDGRQYQWIRHLLDILDQAGSAGDFLDNAKLQMFADEVFCFTPKGDLITLPAGATTIDFAYAVHSEIGDHCVGAKINGKMMPLRTVLANGDQVEVLTSPAQTPSPTWERFVITGKARARIRRFVRTREREQYAQLGRSILEKTFREHALQFSEKAGEEAIKAFKQASVEDLCAQVGAGHLTARTVLESVYPSTKKRPSLYERMMPRARAKRASKADEGGVPINGLIPGMAIHYAGCCHPLPGDRIVGVVTTGKGVTIHTIDCDSLDVYSDSPERWIDVSWKVDAESPSTYTGRIDVTVLNEPGSLGNLTTVIARGEGNITNLKIVNRTAQFFDILVDVEVRDVKHLNEILAALRATPSVTAVERARG